MSVALPTPSACNSTPCCAAPCFGNTAQAFTATCVPGTYGISTATIPANQYFAELQDDADALALAAAQALAEANLQCDSCPECPECPAEAFGPLSHAVWDSARNVIWGARGGVVAKFDENGVLLDYKVLVDPPLGEGYLCLDTVGNRLILSHSCDPNYDLFDSDDERVPRSSNGFYVIDPATFTPGVFQQQSDAYHGPLSIFTGLYERGPRKMLLDSARALWWIYLSTGTSGGPAGTNWAAFDPDSLAPLYGDIFGYYSTRNGCGVCGYNALAYDMDHDVMYSSNGVGVKFVEGSASLGNPGGDLVISINDGFQDVNGIYGMGYCPSNGWLYCVTRKSTVYKFKFNSYPLGVGIPAHTWGSFDLGDAQVTPRNIVYAPFNGKLYIPSIGGNKVLEVDPATDTVTNTYTGFEAPLDIVVTDAHVFAVQLGKVGLKLVV